MTRLDVVIVNWNSGEYLRRAVASLARAAERSPFFRVIVVDNASTDGSCEGLDSGSAPLQVIGNSENRGFAAACNQGAGAGVAPFILFLNPDTVVSREALEQSLGFMSSPAASRVGICGIQLIDDAGRVTRSCARFPTAGSMLASTLGLDRAFPTRFRPHMLLEWAHDTSRPVDEVMGAFFLVRRPLFERLGGFDERYFVYYEELDFCLRAKQTGFDTYYLADVSAVHTGCGTTDRIRAGRYFYATQSRVIYGARHLSTAAAVLHAGAALVLEPLVRTLALAARFDLPGARATLAGAGMLWRSIPRTLRRAVSAPSVPLHDESPAVRMHASSVTNGP